MSEQRDLTMSQYVTLSVMLFRGEGVPYHVNDLRRDVGIALDWLRDARRHARRAGIVDEVLGGNLFIGIVDGEVRFRAAH